MEIGRFSVPVHKNPFHLARLRAGMELAAPELGYYSRDLLPYETQRDGEPKKR